MLTRWFNLRNPFWADPSQPHITRVLDAERASTRLLARSSASVVALVAALALAAPAWAEPVAAPPAEYRWETLPPDQQLAGDRTAIPPGKGAVFVPALSSGKDEPQVLVQLEGTDVAAGPTGRRIIVKPGQYTVVVGSGPTNLGVKQSVEVKADDTVVVPVAWGALRVEVVDDKLIPHRGSYELIRMADRQTFGVAFGADTLQGEPLSSWLLPPGLYRIVLPGSTFRTRSNFATVYVPPAGLARFRLVMDPSTSTFQGAGVLVPGEFGSSGTGGKSRWIRSLVVGLDGSVGHNRKVVGLSDQLALSGSVYLQGMGSFNHKHHLVSLLAEAEAGLSFIKPAEGDALPLLKSQDRLRIDVLYSYLFRDWIGPYARAALNTRMFNSYAFFTQEGVVALTLKDGRTERRAIGTNERFRTSKAFAPTTLQEGIGLNLRPLNHRYVTMSTRLGNGFRHNLFRSTYVEEDLATTSDLEYREVDTFNQIGLEASLRAVVRLTGWLVYTTDFEYFGDYEDFKRPNIDWRNTLTFRISSWLSLNYNLNIVRQPQVVDATQLQQTMLLRAALDIL